MNETMPTKLRVISRFMAQELLHDYVCGELDSARKKSVEKALQDYPELQMQVELIKSANQYCENLSGTYVQEELVEKLTNSKSLIQNFTEKLSWSKWPDVLRWTTEALVLSVMIMSFSLFTPWGKVQNWFSDLSDISTESELLPFDNTKPDKKTVEQKPPDKKSNKNIKESQQKKQEAKAAVTQKQEPVVAKKPVPKPMGVLHRISMKVSGIEGRSTEVRDKIIELGGKKAGRVRLGWRKPNGNYYHFSVPAKNLESLTGTLGEYGPVRLSKHEHPRLMPDGVIRIILFIEDGPELKPAPEPVPEATTDEQKNEEKKETDET